MSANTTFKLSSCKDKRFWDRFVEGSPQANIFCQTPFLDALSINYQLVMVKKNQESQLGAILLKDKKGQPIRSFESIFIYQGLLFDKKYKKKPNHSRVLHQLAAVNFLLQNLEKNQDVILFSLHPKFKDLRSFQWFNYHQPERGQFKINLRYTGLIDLKKPSSFKSYLQTIRKVRRYEYRQALKAELRIEESQDIDKLDYLHQLTFKRQGIRRDKATAQRLRNISQATLSHGFGELLLCKNKQGKEISATLFLYDKKCGYYLFGANHPDYQRTGGGTLLILENIRRCQEKGLCWVDVCGINSPNRGDFKTSFNAKPTPYFVVTWGKPEQ